MPAEILLWQMWMEEKNDLLHFKFGAVTLLLFIPEQTASAPPFSYRTPPKL